MLARLLVDSFVCIVRFIMYITSILFSHSVLVLILGTQHVHIYISTFSWFNVFSSGVQHDNTDAPTALPGQEARRVAHGHHAPAFGVVCRALGVGERQAARAKGLTTERLSDK